MASLARRCSEPAKACEPHSTAPRCPALVLRACAFVKSEGLSCMLTSTAPQLTGGSSATEAHISSITDTIILLRDVELSGEMRRGLTVLKMRGSPHDKAIREFVIEGGGMKPGTAFRNVGGILSGHPAQLPWPPVEPEHLRQG